MLALTERVNGRPMPEVRVVDMRQELRNGNRSMFSEALIDALRDRLEKKEQSVLFLNRRGYSTFVMCRDCGYVASCSHCDISYTYHRNGHSLKCHYCGDEQPMPSECGECGSDHIRFFGSGTQKVEEEIAKLFPEAKVIRMDVDTTRKKGAHKQLLDAFGKGKADILLGTQMIAKGLDFPRITLVGVLAADSMLHIPDFRSAERTFQVLEQVAGRAGRDVLLGEVIVQSYTPEHYSIQLVKHHDYEQFIAKEMQARKHGGYPPYYYMALVTFSDTELASVISASQKIVRFLKESFSEETIVLGPVVSPIARIKDRYRYQCVIKYRHEPKLHQTLETVMHHYLRDSTNKKLAISMDLHPYFFYVKVRSGIVNIIFMGTPAFAVPILKQLIQLHTVLAVVTQPDRPVGRKRVLTPSSVKQEAINQEIPVIQPEKIRHDFVEILAYKPDLIVTAAYGQIVPNEVLDAPKYGCINVHASLLPKYRGGAPIHQAIIDGETKTGISIMYMAEKLDAGDMLSQRSIEIRRKMMYKRCMIS